MNTLVRTARPHPAPFPPFAPTRLPFRRRLHWMGMRWWLRLCRQAERKTRVVPRY